METELIPQYDSRESFHMKARVNNENGRLTLVSYFTEVCYIEDGKAFVLGSWGNTTTRHIKEFLKQNGFTADSGKQMLKDYGVKNE